ncbi:Regulator of nonsense transcripts UPF3 [Smittium culicis]|uniref:Regulator of nonsense transcripts UPF3 n=1 Tax=Smittium culicis TaxID=133412 RepID=A0A1R1YMJ4_9FUNG|nr:Regulator of nonsense transcripts UPF3 [Smittium culicis]OMJ28132.1 Regulator of nonsense transcripts UPF3 [Smittium culicis]
MKTPSEKVSNDNSNKVNKGRNRNRGKKPDAKIKPKSDETITKENQNPQNKSISSKPIKSIKPNTAKPQPKSSSNYKSKKITKSKSIKPLPPSLKLVIRSLPPDLPEHIFWMSIEKFLKWYNPDKPGKIIKISKKISNLSSVTTETQNPLENKSDIQEAGANDKSNNKREGESSDFQNLKSVDSSSENIKEIDIPNGTISKGMTDSNDSNKSSKNIESNFFLCPVTVEDVPVYSSPSLDVLNHYPYWRSFVKGKVTKRDSKLSIPSRAYIKFKDIDELKHFSKAYNGHKFVSKSGIEYTACVEASPFQAAPHDTKHIKDNLCGTIFNDKDFLEFANSKNDSHNDDSTNDLKINDPPTNNSLSVTLSDISSAQKLPNPSSNLLYKSALKSIVGDDVFQPIDDSKKENESTAILDYLRNIKNKKSIIKSSSKAERKSSTRPSRPGKSSLKSKKKLVDQSLKTWAPEQGKVVKLVTGLATGSLIDTSISKDSTKSFNTNPPSKLDVNNANAVRKNILDSIKVIPVSSMSSTAAGTKHRTSRSSRKPPSQGSSSKTSRDGAEPKKAPQNKTSFGNSRAQRNQGKPKLTEN